MEDPRPTRKSRTAECAIAHSLLLSAGTIVVLVGEVSVTSIPPIRRLFPNLEFTPMYVFVMTAPSLQARAKSVTPKNMGAVEETSTSIGEMSLSLVDRNQVEVAPAPPPTSAIECTCGMPLCICEAPAPAPFPAPALEGLREVVKAADAAAEKDLLAQGLDPTYVEKQAFYHQSSIINQLQKLLSLRILHL